MKKIILTIVIFAFFANVSAQLKVNSSGNVEIGGVIATTSNVPITFKVNGSSAGFTGNYGNSNVSFGVGALPNSLTGSYNAAYGSYALQFNTTGTGNTANGSSALQSNTIGTDNTANGNGALACNKGGTNNTAIGGLALQVNISGNYNTASGFQALYSNTTGSMNTAIGFYAGALNPNNLTNSTAIGYQATASASNQVRIGNSSVISIGGYANWSNISDGRAKKNMKADVPGLDFINLLQPVTYNLDLDEIDNLLGIDKAVKDKLEKDMPQDLKDKNEKAKKNKQDEVQTGFVAQDVEKAAKKVGYNFNGVNVDEKGIYSLSYAEFVVPLVKAVQELSAKNDAKDAAIASLQEQVTELTGLVNKLLGKDADTNVFRSENGGASATGLTELAATAPASLEQNVPNPFNHSTVVHYTLPETCTSAKILITNTTGRAIQQIPLSVSGGHDSIMIKGGSLQAGIYLYSLICDGKVVDTKRMVLTK